MFDLLTRTQFLNEKPVVKQHVERVQTKSLLSSFTKKHDGNERKKESVI